MRPVTSRGYGIPERDIETVWDAVSLHTTPGIPEHKKAEVALVTSGVAAKHGKGILMLDALTKRGFATAYSEWLAAIVQNIKPCEAAANR
jgi:hypothetical protein